MSPRIDGCRYCDTSAVLYARDSCFRSVRTRQPQAQHRIHDENPGQEPSRNQRIHRRSSGPDIADDREQRRNVANFRRARQTEIIDNRRRVPRTVIVIIVTCRRPLYRPLRRYTDLQSGSIHTHSFHRRRAYYKTYFM